MSTKTQVAIQKAALEKLYGEHSLTAGELVGILIGGYLVLRPPKQLGEKWGRILGLAIIFVTEALF